MLGQSRSSLEHSPCEARLTFRRATANVDRRTRVLVGISRASASRQSLSDKLSSPYRRQYRCVGAESAREDSRRRARHRSPSIPTSWRRRGRYRSAICVFLSSAQAHVDESSRTPEDVRLIRQGADVAVIVGVRPESVCEAIRRINDMISDLESSKPTHQRRIRNRRDRGCPWSKDCSKRWSETGTGGV